MSDRSMGVLQQADEERARRKDNPDDWPQIRARLEKLSGTRWAEEEDIAADIRAALQRVEMLERQVADEAWIDDLEREAKALRQRVEELERERDPEKLETWGRGLTLRAEAAEAKLARVVEAADHGIPFYAYGNNEAAAEFAHRLEQILAAAKGDK